MNTVSLEYGVSNRWEYATYDEAEAHVVRLLKRGVFPLSIRVWWQDLSTGEHALLLDGARIKERRIIQGKPICISVPDNA